jgi:hypothetical protein
MNSALSPLAAVVLVLVLLLLFDFASGAVPAVYVAFAPTLLWAIVVLARRRA